MINRRTFVVAAATLIAAPRFALAQGAVRKARIAYLSANPVRPGDFRSQGFLQGLRELGYSEGKDVIIEHFNAPTVGDLRRFAARAVASAPDIIVAVSTMAAIAAKEQTTKIPIVFFAVSAPVAAGIVTSLSLPGGNITGVSLMSTDLAGKRLQLLRDLVPDLSRVAVFHIPDNTASPRRLAAIQAAGAMLSIAVRPVSARSPEELESGFAEIAAEGMQAVIMVGSFVYTNNVGRIAELALQYRLPTIGGLSQYSAAGVFVSYGPRLTDNFRRAAYYVDRILKGTRPEDLPVEQPTVFDFVVNLKTARALGITVPPILLIQATELIE